VVLSILRNYFIFVGNSPKKKKNDPVPYVFVFVGIYSLVIFAQQLELGKGGGLPGQMGYSIVSR
jgi:hypothetical protein